MTGSSKLQKDLPLEDSIPTTPLESILNTEELGRRLSRPPDYQKEKRALVALANAMVDPWSAHERWLGVSGTMGIDYDLAYDSTREQTAAPAWTREPLAGVNPQPRTCHRYALSEAVVLACIVSNINGLGRHKVGLPLARAYLSQIWIGSPIPDVQ